MSEIPPQKLAFSDNVIYFHLNSHFTPLKFSSLKLDYMIIFTKKFHLCLVLRHKSLVYPHCSKLRT